MQVQGWGAGWESLFWVLFERTANAVALVDEQHRFVDINAAAVDLFGTSRDEIVGASLFATVPPAGRRDAEKGWQELMRTGQDIGSSLLTRPDGTETEVDFAAQVALIDERKLAIFVTIPGSEHWRAAGAGTPPARALTSREREVVTLVALGFETNGIAQELHISPETARTHVRNAMSKLQARTRAQLVALALATGELIDLPSVGGSPPARASGRSAS